MKTLWIEDEDALNVGRVIVTKTRTKYCVVCYSCDEKDDYENRLKADLEAILVELQLEIEKLEEEADIGKVVMIGAVDRLIQQKINSLKTESEVENADSN